jgi:hypothetical protein
MDMLYASSEVYKRGVRMFSDSERDENKCLIEHPDVPREGTGGAKIQKRSP